MTTTQPVPFVHRAAPRRLQQQLPLLGRRMLPKLHREQLVDGIITTCYFSLLPLLHEMTYTSRTDLATSCYKAIINLPLFTI